MVDTGEHLQPGTAPEAVDLVDDDLGGVVRGVPDDHSDRGRVAPSQCRRARRQRPFHLAAYDMVDDERLQPGVPGTALLSGTGIDDRAGEGDVTGVAQHIGQQPLLVLGAGQGGYLSLDRLDSHPHEIDQPAEGDRSNEIAGGDPEDVSGQLPGVFGPPAPLHEGRDPSLHHHLDVGPVAC